MRAKRQETNRKSTSDNLKSGGSASDPGL